MNDLSFLIDGIIQGIISGLLIGGVYSSVAIGLTLIFGVLHVINFAHGELMMIAMYLTWVISSSFHINPYLSVFLVLPVSFIFGMLIQKYLLETIKKADPTIKVLVTLGLSIVLQNTALLIWGPDQQSLHHFVGIRSSFLFFGYMISIPRAIAFFASMLMATILFVFLKKTNLGSAIRACADNREGALLIGIRVDRVFVITFGIGAACAGVAGVFIMPFYYASPHMGINFVLVAFVVVILGGLGSVEGAFLGGLIIGVLECVASILTDESLKQIFTFSVFILILFFKPLGLFGKKLR